MGDPAQDAEALLREVDENPRMQVVLLASKIPGVKRVTILMADGQEFSAERTAE